MVTTRPRVALDGQYTMTEAARLLGVDRKTIWRWRDCGYMKDHKHRHNSRSFVLGREILKMYDNYE